SSQILDGHLDRPLQEVADDLELAVAFWDGEDRAKVMQLSQVVMPVAGVEDQGPAQFPFAPLVVDIATSRAVSPWAARALAPLKGFLQLPASFVADTAECLDGALRFLFNGAAILGVW